LAARPACRAAISSIMDIGFLGPAAPAGDAATDAGLLAPAGDAAAEGDVTFFSCTQWE
jgi:hypothetical protein